MFGLLDLWLWQYRPTPFIKCFSLFLWHSLLVFPSLSLRNFPIYILNLSVSSKIFLKVFLAFGTVWDSVPCSVHFLLSTHFLQGSEVLTIPSVMMTYLSLYLSLSLWKKTCTFVCVYIPAFWNSPLVHLKGMYLKRSSRSPFTSNCSYHLLLNATIILFSLSNQNLEIILNSSFPFCEHLKTITF